MLEEIPENPHAEAIDLQEVQNQPDRPAKVVKVHSGVSDGTPESQSSAPTVRHVRDYSTSTNFTVDTECSGDSDDFGPRDRDQDADDDDDLKEEPELTIWDHLKNPKVYGTIIVIFGFLIIGVICGTQIFEAIIGAKQWFLDHPLISVPWYCILFSVASAVFMPYGPFCISVGYIWGLRWGFPVQLCAIFVSSAFIYVVGRVLLKKRVTEYTNKYRLWRAIMDKMGSDWREAAKINILMCFIPMPYGTHAYLFSLSECTFTCFVTVFEVGMIGHTFLNLAVGDALAMSAELGTESTSTLQFVGTIVGVVAMVMSIWYGGIVTQRIMDQQYSEDKILVKNACTDADCVTGLPCEEDLESGAAGVQLRVRKSEADLAPRRESTVIELVLEAGPESESGGSSPTAASSSTGGSPPQQRYTAPAELEPVAM